ncbi:MAG: response regulator [Anaerolineales bacterium]|jgi:DNA-binding response OmpR family regulator
MKKILIAEDERDIRELVAFTLERHGFAVISSADGRTALELAAKEQPDLALLDVRMPRMDGYEVCRRIKADPTLTHIPVIFLSAKGQEAEVQAGLEAGAQAYIIKPFSMDDLISQIQKTLRA